MKMIIVFISFTKNNTFFSISDSKGQILEWISLGRKCPRGLKKLSFVSSSFVSSLIIKKIISLGCLNIHLRIRGFNKSKNTIIKFFKHSLLHFITLNELTSVPYNGCRLKKMRRL